MKLALAHDWILNHRGAERVLTDFCRGFDPVRIYTVFLDPDALSPELRGRTIYRSLLGRWPGVHRAYRFLLPWLPRAVETLEVDDCDTLISVSHSVVKGIPRTSGIQHFCCCLTPMRYLWEPRLYASIGGAAGAFYRFGLHAWGGRLKEWDLKTSGRVDRFVAISETVRNRIQRIYGRDAEVIYPGIDLEQFQPTGRGREDFYLIVSALVPQKQLELAVDAFNQSGRRLIVAGSGPWRRRLERRARANVRFLGWQTDESIRDLYSRARALIFPGVEDFGLVPVEAQAMGCPVIAYADGGVTESVVDGETGYFFRLRSEESLNQAVRRLDREPLDPARITANAARFSRERFLAAWRRLLVS